MPSGAPTGTATSRSWCATGSCSERGSAAGAGDASPVTGWSRDDVLLLPGRRLRPHALTATRSPWSTTRPGSTTTRWRPSPAGPTSRRRPSCCPRRPGGGLPAADLHSHRGAARSPGTQPSEVRMRGSAPAERLQVPGGSSRSAASGLVELVAMTGPRLPGARPARAVRSTRRPSPGLSPPCGSILGASSAPTGSTTGRDGSDSSSTSAADVLELRPDFVAMLGSRSA